MKNRVSSLLGALLLLLLAAGAAFSQGCSGIPNANTGCFGPTSGGAGFPAFRSMVSGDIGAGTVGNTNIAAGAVSNSNLANMSANTVKGNPTGSPATPTDSQVVGAQIASGTIANSNLVNETANTVKGNFTSGAAAPSDNAVPGCNNAAAAGTSALQYTTNSSLGCNNNLANLTIADQVVTGGGLVTPNNLTAGTSFVLDCGKVPLQWILNSAAFTITAPSMTTTNSQNCAVRVINGSTASNAGAVTLTNFSGKSPGGATFSTAPTISAASISFSNGSANITWTANGLPLGSIVFFATTGSLPTNFATATLYYVVTTGTNTIQVASTPGGTAITAGSAGSGTQTGYEPSVFDFVVLAINGPVYAQWVQIQ